MAPGVEAYNSQRANPVKFTGSHAGKQHCMNGGTRSEREQVDSDPEILCGIHFLSEPSQLPLASDEHYLCISGAVAEGPPSYLWLRTSTRVYHLCISGAVAEGEQLLVCTKLCVHNSMIPVGVADVAF